MRGYSHGRRKTWPLQGLRVVKETGRRADRSHARVSMTRACCSGMRRYAARTWLRRCGRQCRRVANELTRFPRPNVCTEKEQLRRNQMFCDRFKNPGIVCAKQSSISPALALHGLWVVVCANTHFSLSLNLSFDVNVHCTVDPRHGQDHPRFETRDVLHENVPASEHEDHAIATEHVVHRLKAKGIKLHLTRS